VVLEILLQHLHLKEITVEIAAVQEMPQAVVALVRLALMVLVQIQMAQQAVLVHLIQ
jgi:hypothetical protein